ncbi:hypothetical protein [Tateyamaria omphalii]|uniref:Uncharacterized protein n=1 Tax=Tateyamaria omphalii TaxID=299262 RepID=A0A1P8MSE1_9RHOB|nr:hypothetical protein [Tateyamaria omphalii]APX10965.1 hypothetical protein BWR18_04110 [Tateyamaria omphalii]
MQITTRTVHDITIFPYVPGVAATFEPVVSCETGVWRQRRLLNHGQERLVLDADVAPEGLSIGASYGWRGHLDDGTATGAMWTFCTDLAPRVGFGVTRNWARPGCVAPLYGGLEDAVLRLEPLRDVIALIPSPNPSVGLAQAQLGRAGWLVMLSSVVPACVGFLIEEAHLPLHLCEGAEGVSIKATSLRTLQTIGLQDLRCAQASDTSLFLREISSC